ncbi:Methyltransferase domain-containing protein [Atopomonas hussainii]|uniref:Methyltransferase domain-containing protein n=1 Tax=Atopomonas hussainii TaxID=1429083 RepID=A0A1H7P114_9GAMM|nr:methyltransferase [Atopomonas hussainii]SEL28935.1 Methyltransferase domain-containing protein [Atopomonas hussainii]
MLTGPALRERFAALDHWLCQHRPLWQEAPFTHAQLSWESAYPELAQWLREQTLEHAERYQGQPHLLRSAPTPFSALAAESVQLGQLDALPTHSQNTVAARYAVDIPGRKWQQIDAFASILPQASNNTHWLDWCSGKSHLGRHLLHRLGGELTSLEWDAALVDEARRLTNEHNLCASHHVQDVLAADCAAQLQAEHSPVALHACGELHLQLLRLASQANCTQLAVAPCCYNRIDGPDYQPLSHAAQQAQLQLSRADLRLTLRESVNAGQRARRLRDQSMARRLAFGQLCQQRLGTSAQQATPSIASKWLGLPFHQWAEKVAEYRELELPLSPSDDALEAQGWARLAQIRNLELLGNLFRRPLELWLLLDRALFLEEQGYRVQLGTFCPSSLTPRNALLLACKR